MKTAITVAIAGAALIALPAMAQTTSKPATDHSTTTSAQTEKKAPMYEMKPGEWRATKLKGLSVYNANNDKIGDINEMIVSREGKIEAVVIGVGGFLGMGEHDVAVPFAQVKWMDEPVNKTASTSTTTRPNTASGTSTAPATTTPAPTTDRTAGATDRTTTTADNTRTSSRDHTYPDHAVVNMTKDQLKALPEVKYSR